MKKNILIICFFHSILFLSGQSVLQTMLRLPDTGVNTSYTTTPGEDADYSIFLPFFTVNGDGTATDTITGLMWQQSDGGEMTIEDATIYCDTLTLGGYTDWRLPSAHEAFSVLNLKYVNPPLDNTIFTTTGAEYWWSGTRQANDSSVVWVTNAGGGIGNHHKSETVSAGGTKFFHVRAVRETAAPGIIPSHFMDNGDGTITDNVTLLTWQKAPYSDTLSWEDALKYADSLTLAGQTDWRLPNIKELQSINDESLIGPSVNTNYFSSIGINKYWSSTTLPNQTDKAWYLFTQFGITTYNPKTKCIKVICVRGNPENGTSVSEYSGPAAVIVFPNPASDKIFISAPNAYSAEIMDLCGKLILKEISDLDSAIDISSFDKGIYIIKITTDKNTFTKKIIKE